MATHKLYVDACCIIEVVIDDVSGAAPEKADGVDMMRRLIKASRDKKIQLYTSMMSVAEVVKAGNAPITDDVKQRIERMLMSGRDGFTLIGITPFIATRARDLAWANGMAATKGADRIHVASAQYAKAKEFISWDNRLGKKIQQTITGLKFIAPDETNYLPSEYRANDLFGEK